RPARISRGSRAPVLTTPAWLYRWLYGAIGDGPSETELEYKSGAGAGTRTPDPRLKSPSRPPHDAFPGLLPYSDLRPAPPPGSHDSPGLAIQIGYASEGPERSPSAREHPNGEAPSHLAPSGDCLPWS